MGHKVLLVDDEPDILEFVSYNLLAEGYSVECAQNGNMALQKVQEFKPDLVLLDVMMPVMDGVETCEKIRQMDDCQNIIIAFLSARNEDFSQIAGLEAGADDYITKPIRPKLLISKVRSLLKRKESISHENPDFMIDRVHYCVHINGEKIVLPRK
ncbi:MAG: response regulator transcription factor, partial [Rikenellaceae bacterium]